MAGKTNILLREGDRNVLIAECKVRKGPKAFIEPSASISSIHALLGNSVI